MTATLLLLVGTGAACMAVYAVQHTNQVKMVLARTHARNHLPKVISMMVLTVQFGELLKVIDHLSVTHFTGALLLLGVLWATKAGTEGEPIHK